jgi:hypothetical protein
MARSTAILKITFLPLLALALAAAIPVPSHATWATFGSPATLADSNQVLPKSISDGAGGVFIAWEDYRNGFGDADVYAQHLDASGNPLWGANGTPVAVLAGSNQESPVLSLDGSGGIIVAWQDTRNGFYDIYSQALDATGAPRWTAGGVPICTASGNQVLQVSTEDAAGGAIIGWRDLRGLDSDIYAQRVNHAGAALWTANGVAVCDTIGTQTDVRILSDQVGGAFLLWRDRRAGGVADDLYAQRLDANGVPQWPKNGVAVVTADGAQTFPAVIGDGRYGLVATWIDHRSVNPGIYAQRVLPNGAPKWTANGVLVSAPDLTKDTPILASDGQAGAIIAWTDTRNGIRSDVYAQSLDSLGVRRWAPADGIAVCATDSTQAAVTIVSDKLGGAIVGWMDDRAGFREIYGQHVGAAGTLLWAPLGVKIGTGAGQRNLRSASPDGYGGCIFVWEDFRNGPTSDIYAYRITSLGTGVEASASPAAGVRLDPARPNPFNPHTTLSFQIDHPGRATLTLFDVRGRFVRRLADANMTAGRHEFAWDGIDGAGRACASGVYFALLRTAGAERRTTLTLLR